MDSMIRVTGHFLLYLPEWVLVWRVRVPSALPLAAANRVRSSIFRLPLARQVSAFRETDFARGATAASLGRRPGGRLLNGRQ